MENKNETLMTESSVEDLLIEQLTDNGFYCVTKFSESGLLTNDSGVVATTIDGIEYQITIQKVKD